MPEAPAIAPEAAAPSASELGALRSLARLLVRAYLKDREETAIVERSDADRVQDDDPRVGHAV